MLNIFICEDNDEERKNIEKSIKGIIKTENINSKISLSTSDPYEVLNYVNGNDTYGLYFLDVELNKDITGIKLAEEIRKYDTRGFIVFITAHAEMSYLTFLYKVEAMDYIVKDDYYNINLRIHDCIVSAYKRFCFKSVQISQNFILKLGEKLININFDDILFFETSKNIHKVILHCKNRQIEFYGEMKNVQKQLDSRFFRCHRSFIVNKSNITKIDLEKRIIYMKNEEQCTVSLRLLKSLKDTIDMSLYL